MTFTPRAARSSAIDNPIETTTAMRGMRNGRPWAAPARAAPRAETTRGRCSRWSVAKGPYYEYSWKSPRLAPKTNQAASDSEAGPRRRAVVSSAASLRAIGTAGALVAFLLFAYLHMAADPRLWVMWSAARVLMPVPVLLALSLAADAPADPSPR